MEHTRKPRHREYGLAAALCIDLWEALQFYFGEDRWSEVTSPEKWTAQRVGDELSNMEKDPAWQNLAPEDQGRLKSYSDRVIALLEQLKSAPSEEWFEAARKTRDELRTLTFGFSRRIEPR